jgi:hypothetical protein
LLSLSSLAHHEQHPPNTPNPAPSRESPSLSLSLVLVAVTVLVTVRNAQPLVANHTICNRMHTHTVQPRRGSFTLLAIRPLTRLQASFAFS